MFLATNQFTGSIPAELGNLINLQSLDLAENNLSGALPVQISNLNKLVLFVVQANDLSGCYTEGLNALCDQLISDNPDFDINNGNNFDGLWTGFCQCNVGSCNTEFDLEINANTTFQNHYFTEGNIITKGDVNINPGQNGTYEAAVTTLNPGFEAKLGCELLVIPKNCE